MFARFTVLSPLELNQVERSSIGIREVLDERSSVLRCGLKSNAPAFQDLLRASHVLGAKSDRNVSVRISLRWFLPGMKADPDARGFPPVGALTVGSPGSGGLASSALIGVQESIAPSRPGGTGVAQSLKKLAKLAKAAKRVVDGTRWWSTESAIPTKSLRIRSRLGCKRSRVQISPARPLKRCRDPSKATAIKTERRVSP